MVPALAELCYLTVVLFNNLALKLKKMIYARQN